MPPRYRCHFVDTGRTVEEEVAAENMRKKCVSPRSMSFRRRRRRAVEEEVAAENLRKKCHGWGE